MRGKVKLQSGDYASAKAILFKYDEQLAKLLIAADVHAVDSTAIDNNGNYSFVINEQGLYMVKAMVAQSTLMMILPL